MKPKQLISTLKLKVKYRTLLRFLHKNNFSARSVTRKPFIKTVTKQKRLSYAAKMIHQPNLIPKLVFVDEKRFTLDKSFNDERVWIREKSNEMLNDITNTAKAPANIRSTHKNYDKQ